MRSYHLEPKDLVEGQFFYENDMGMSVLFIVLTAPIHRDTESETGWRWTAKCVCDGEEIGFFRSSKYSGYGPHISKEPEYMNVVPKLKKPYET